MAGSYKERFRPVVSLEPPLEATPPRNPQFRVDVDDVNASGYRVPQIVIIGA